LAFFSLGYIAGTCQNDIIFIVIGKIL